LRYWSKTLNVTPERLKELVKEHGVSARKIREVLGIQPVAPKPRSKKIA
jgi:chemotaxis signal transduction protein